jgi:hypothetical protein
MADQTYVTDEMRAALGKEYGEQISYPIAASDIRKWAMAIYYPDEPPRLFWDEEYAATTKWGGIVAPEEFNPFGWISASPRPTFGRSSGDGQGAPDVENNVGVAGPGLEHMLNGGMEVEYGVRMRPGDVIRSITSLTSYSEREGRLGLMLFTISESRWTNQDKELVKKTSSILIRY